MTTIRERQRRKRRRQLIINITAIAAVAVCLVLYFGFAHFFKTHFFYKTTLNGISVGGMTAEEAQNRIQQETQDYLLTIYDRDGKKYSIKGHDIGYDYVAKGQEAELIDAQKRFTWLGKVWKTKEESIDTSISYDEKLLEEAIDALGCFDPENVQQPENADIAWSDENKEFVVIHETMGNALIEDAAKKQIQAAVADGETELTFADEDYQNPQVKADDESITSCMSALESYMKSGVTYKIGDDTEVVDAAVLEEWLTISDDYQVTLDESKIETYVQSLASKYNTYADERQFKTSKGDTITIGGGDYGWVIDKEKEAEQLKADIASGAQVEREPIYNQEAIQHGTDDIGNTYVEIDYTNQHLWFYQDGELVVETDIVSGNIAKENGSPDGVFKIVYKKSPDVLKGEDYESNVNYFMPFAYNVGIHDASWRNGQFGGQIYKTSGSHGCINVPEEAAAAIYEKIEVGTPVIAFYREPTVLNKENTKIANAYSYVEPETETEGGTTPTDTSAAGTPAQ